MEDKEQEVVKEAAKNAAQEVAKLFKTGSVKGANPDAVVHQPPEAAAEADKQQAAGVLGD